jgi:uncharacterized membrane protein YeaQ/YmgE (transglycosylase-associated protein family)
MEILLVIGGMVVVGAIIGAVAGLIWKNDRPYGAAGDYLISIITTVLIGLIDWYVIPAMGFSDTMRNLGLLIEPALGAIIVLWIVRRAKK